MASALLSRGRQLRPCYSGELLAVDLVGRGEWQSVDAPHEARVLIRRGMGEGVALDVLCSQGHTGAQHDECDWLLAFDVVVNREHTGLFDGRMRLEHFFDLAGIDILSTTHEHVIDPANEVVEAVLVAAEDVPRDVKPVVGERRLEVRPVVVTYHEGRTLHLEDTYVSLVVGAIDQPHLHLRMGIPY